MSLVKKWYLRKCLRMLLLKQLIFQQTSSWGEHRHSSYSPGLKGFDPYHVGSVNLSRRKIGHVHDNSADSENVAGAREPNVHALFIFRFENGQGNQSFFLSMPKYSWSESTASSIDVPWTGRAREASSGP